MVVIVVINNRCVGMWKSPGSDRSSFAIVALSYDILAAVVVVICCQSRCGGMDSAADLATGMGAVQPTPIK